MVPPCDIGMQLRGAYQWGQLGQDADYTVWVANGPSYDTSLPQPVIGQAINGSTTSIPTPTARHMAGGSAYIHFRSTAISAGLSWALRPTTANGINSLWLNSWGVDFAYLRGNLQDTRFISLSL